MSSLSIIPREEEKWSNDTNFVIFKIYIEDKRKYELLLRLKMLNKLYK